MVDIIAHFELETLLVQDLKQTKGSCHAFVVQYRWSRPFTIAGRSKPTYMCNSSTGNGAPCPQQMTRKLALAPAAATTKRGRGTAGTLGHCSGV